MTAVLAQAPRLSPCRSWLGLIALLGLPPFSLFFSEVAIVRGRVPSRPRLGDGGRGGTRPHAVRRVGAAYVHADVRPDPGRMLPAQPGPPHRPDEPPSRPEVCPRPAGMPLVVALGVTAVVGFAGGPLATLLAEAAYVLAGTP